jgi:hypothetical protein
MIVKKLFYQNTLIKSNKNINCASYKYILITNICKPIFVTFGRIGPGAYSTKILEIYVTFTFLHVCYFKSVQFCWKQVFCNRFVSIF